MANYGVSWTTIRKAVALLRSDGIQRLKVVDDQPAAHIASYAEAARRRAR